MERDPLALDYERETKRIASFIQRTVGDSGAKGVVLGLSGGVDSAVVGALCVQTLGKDRVTGLLIPSAHTPPGDLEDAQVLGNLWGIRLMRFEISPLVDAITSGFPTEGDRVAKANVQARLRMTVAYYVANMNSLLVAGTGDRSESLVGYYTKYGDGGVDFLPIAHLYKTQVRGLGAHLGLPEVVVLKPASPGLWPGHTAAEELPADYNKLDIVLHYMFDRKLSPAKAAARAGIPVKVAQQALAMHDRGGHKRKMPPSLAAKF